METNTTDIAPDELSPASPGKSPKEPRLRVSLFEGRFNPRQSSVKDALEVTWSDLSDLVTRHTWSPIEYADSVRRSSAFKSCSVLAIDVDEGCTLERARELFAEYRCLIGTTKSHQKEKRTKSGTTRPANDRFRVILFPERPMNRAEYLATLEWAGKNWPFIDLNATDEARLFFPCTEIVHSFEGLPVPVAPPKLRPTLATSATTPMPLSGRGRLSKSTLDFLNSGARPGLWHGAFFKAAVDIKEQLYSRDEAEALLVHASTYSPKTLDEQDIFQLNYVYDRYEVRYPPRPHLTPSRKESSMETTTAAGSLTIPSLNERLAKYNDEKEMLALARKSAIPFIGPAFAGKFDLTIGGTLIGACTGDGKSTVAAAVAAGFFKHAKDKHVLIVSNEDLMTDTLTRISCVLLGFDFRRSVKGTLEKRQSEAIEKLNLELMKRVVVLTEDMNQLESIQSVLEYVRTSQGTEREVGLVLVDYLQTVSQSRDNTSLTHVEISKRLGFEFLEFGRKVPVPFVVFAQLKPDAYESSFSSRVQNDQTVVNHFAVAIEVNSDPAGRTSDFIFHKDRFSGMRGKTVRTDFADGRFETIKNTDYI